ncbi:MAG: NADP-specific glutamate dehydrogenase [Cyclobacteriaceae bacterium]|nr:NADP-specific glutamate dehydrogenase [Cyclobacteriaceae bacterium]
MPINDVESSENPEVRSFMELIYNRNPNELEFIQAVQEVAEVVIPFLEDHREYKQAKILESICEPERVFSFRIPWIRDSGEYMINRGYRIQMNSATGPYKGGLRFHPSLNYSVLKFLAFEQVFKNSLTNMNLGAAKGGSDFDPKNKSDREIMGFCQSFITALFPMIGPEMDIPAGDIGVGPREIGFMFGQYKRLLRRFNGVITGKGSSYGGSLMRPEATGYGNVYFAKEMLDYHDETLKGKKCLISGSGNVSLYTAEKLLENDAKVVSLSDSDGTVHIPDGLTGEMLEFVKDLKFNRRGRIHEFAEKFDLEHKDEEKPWGIPCDAAFPCATQNEITGNDAEILLNNGCRLISEGANMPCTSEASRLFREKGILYGIGKAANAGGVTVSGLEMTQNAIGYTWTKEAVDKLLRENMKKIHQQCCKYGEVNGKVDYIKGANIAGFVQVARAMLAQGHV